MKFDIENLKWTREPASYLIDKDIIEINGMQKSLQKKWLQIGLIFLSFSIYYVYTKCEEVFICKHK